MDLADASVFITQGDDGGEPSQIGSGARDAAAPAGSQSEHDGDADNVCTRDDLKIGAPVHEAELEGGVFRKVELLK